MRYELKASVGVVWKEEKRVVTDLKEVDVVENFKEDEARVEPEGVVVAENGKIWVHGRVVGGVVVAGESGCVELEVKNHSSKKVFCHRQIYLDAHSLKSPEYGFDHHSIEDAPPP